MHGELKAKMAGAYSGRDISTLEPSISARITDLLHLLRTTYPSTPLDISIVAQLFTMDVLSTIAFGSCFGYLAANTDVYGYAAANAAFLGPLELMANHRSIYNLFSNKGVNRLMAPKGTDAMGFGRILGIARDAVAERFVEGDGKVIKKDMLGHFVGKGLSKLQCEVEGALQILAGGDSTSTILRCTLYELAGNVVAYSKVRGEIDGAVERGELSFPVVTYAEAQELKYLEAVIWEGMRMWPPLFGTKAKLAPKGGDTIKGIFFPEGTEVGVCDAALCRNKEVFGEDAEVFRPDRWMVDEKTSARYRYVVESIFGTGRYVCLGRHIAMIELFKVFTEVSRVLMSLWRALC